MESLVVKANRFPTKLSPSPGDDGCFRKSPLSLDVIFVICFQNEGEVGTGLQAPELLGLKQIIHVGQVLAELNACDTNRVRFYCCGTLHDSGDG